MLGLELENAKKADTAHRQSLSAIHTGRQVQSQAAMLRQSMADTQQDLAASKDIAKAEAKKLDPKIMKVAQDLGTAASDLGGRVATVKDALRQTSAQLTSVGVKADQALTNSVALASSLNTTQRELQTRLGQVESEIAQADTSLRSVQSEVQRIGGSVNQHLLLHDETLLRYQEAMSSYIKFYADAITENLSAAALNAAAAGTFTRDLTVTLVSEMTEGVRYVHSWALTPVVISAEASADPDIDPPEVKDHDDPTADPPVIPKFKIGELRLLVIFDTDAGVTKTYAEHDSLTVTVKGSALAGSVPDTSKIMGWDVPDFTMTYNVIA